MKKYNYKSFNNYSTKMSRSIVARQPWLRLTCDVNDQFNYEEYEIVLTKDALIIMNAEGQELKEIQKLEIHSVHIKEAVGGASFHVVTDDDEIEVGRFTIPYIDAFQMALPQIQSWILSDDHEFNTEGSLKLEPHVCSKCGKTLKFGRSKCLRCTRKYESLRRMLGYCKPYKKMLMASAGLLLVSVATGLIPPYISKLLIDEISSPSGNFQVLIWIIGTLAAVQIVDTGMQVLRSFIGIRMGSHLIGDIRRDMFHALMRLSMRFFDRRQVSQFIGRINNDTDELKEFLTDGLIQCITQVLTAICIIGLMFSLNASLTFAILIPLPLLVIGFLWIWPRIRMLWYAQWQSSIMVQTIIGQALQGIRVIKAFAQENNEMNRFDVANQNQIKRNISINNMWISITPVFTLFTAMCGTAIWYVGGRYVIEGTMSLGTLTAYTTYLMMFFGPIQWFAQSISLVNRALSASERILEVIDAPIDVPDQTDALVEPFVDGDIRLNQVRYGYEKDHPVIKGIDLHIRSGEMIGLVGRSGAGKSTLIHLLCRFYDPDNGSILLDGHNLKDFKQEDLRKHIGVVFQETFLFDGPISQNIAFGCPDASIEEIIEAARIANAHDFICRLPDGYDTQVGERGHRLSGGEKQRIAIARAVLLNPPILILDEATASVDTHTERQIQIALNRLVQGRTTIAIAHRLSTLRNADRLVVMEQGEIAEVGTHVELIERRGAYFRLVESQKQMNDEVQEEVEEYV